MKKLMLACGLILGAATATFAQGGYQQQPPADRAKALQTALKLTDDQTAKVAAIYTMTAAKRDSMTKAGADRTAMRPLRDAETAKVKALLTADQAAAMEKMPQGRGRGGQGGGGGMGGQGGGNTPPPPPSK